MYINQEDQKQIEKYINEYLDLMNNGEIKSKRAEQIMTTLFTKYFDKLIYGMIYNQKYRFWIYGDIDELLQEARFAIILSIQKNQFDSLKGNIFNFFSTVISKNLMNYTTKQNKHKNKNIQLDINDIFCNPNVFYFQNYHNDIVFEEVFDAMREFFKGKDKFIKLTELLYHYYNINVGLRFVKKNFIAYAKAYNFSPATVNNFFSHCKKIKTNKQVKMLLESDNE